MIEPIVNFFDKLVDDFTWRRLSLLLSAIIFVAVSLWIYESYTGSFKLGKLEKQLVLLEKLSDLSNYEPIQNNPTLSATYEALSLELNSLNDTGFDLVSISREMKQAIAAVLPWLAFALILLFMPAENNSSAIAGIAIAAIPLSVIGYWIPPLEESWVNYALYPITSFVVCMYLVITWQRKKENA